MVFGEKWDISNRLMSEIKREMNGFEPWPWSGSSGVLTRNGLIFTYKPEEKPDLELLSGG